MITLLQEISAVKTHDHKFVEVNLPKGLVKIPIDKIDWIQK